MLTQQLLTWDGLIANVSSLNCVCVQNHNRTGQSIIDNRLCGREAEWGSRSFGTVSKRMSTTLSVAVLGLIGGGSGIEIWPYLLTCPVVAFFLVQRRWHNRHHRDGETFGDYAGMTNI